MPLLGWGVAGLLLIVVAALVWVLRRERARYQQELVYREERSHGEVEERARQAVEDVERHRAVVEASLDAQRAELRETRAAQERREARLHEREDRLAAEAEGLDERGKRLDEQRAMLREERHDVAVLKERITAELERVAGLSIEDATRDVIAEAQRHAKLQATAIARDIESTAKREAEHIARGIVVTAIQRIATEQTSESVVSTVGLPTDDMKGRIIGREGRNIRAFEQITGVNVLIDDTPESVLISSFDPVRREIARLTLTDLVADGRIHPARIEEAFERSERRIHDRIERAAEDALAEVGIVDLAPGLLPTLGALAYRTSYGQNVLKHLIECAHLAGIMAAELGLDIAICKRAAFLHDIGKAITHEVEGPHALIGAELLRSHGEHEDVIHAVEAHHNDIEPRTVEAVLTQAADAISGARPGARRESLEAYVERMEHLESIAVAHDGVMRAYAMQAGRELRVMVAPERIDDAGIHALARDIAAQVEKNLSYPGQIRVTVVRESRAMQTAH